MSAVVTTGPELGSGALVADDDYPRHHAALAGGEPATPVPASWAERWYFNIQRPAGELVAVVGGAIYPGRGVAECYLCVLDGASQTNVRVWQPLAAPDPATPVDGPFRFSCTEPLERWEIAVASGTLALEAEFTATAAPYVYDPIDVPADVGDEATFDRWRHFVGVGRIAGTLGGAPIAADALSTRDRTWGIRSRRPRLHNWYVLHFAEGFLTLIHQERADGSVLFSEAAFSHAGGAVQRLTVVGHDLRFARDTRRLERGTVDLLADGGEPVTLRIEAAGRA
ncbi:MAG: hypothetical protein JWQ18_598, partial [Conexibacter sp.]|nr:hypothetical protein [Conexibacter sp.]